MKTLYISDLDGTLLGRDRKISARSVELINELLDKGLKFTIATARSIASAKAAISELHIKIPIIVYNGGFLIDPVGGEVIASAAFSGEEKALLAKYVAEHDIYPLVHSFIDGTEHVSWIEGRENEGIEYYKETRKGDKRLRPVNTMDALYEGSVVYISPIGDRDEMEALYHAVRDLGFVNVIFQKEIYRPEFWCEMMPKRASKANAAEKLKELCGCDFIVTFGDAINDLPLFMISDECYAVENAVEELKSAATGIISSNDNDGVANWLTENAVY